MSFIDDYSRKILVSFTGNKLKTFVKFILWKIEVENQIWIKIKCLNSGNGTEYIDLMFLEFCEYLIIKRHVTVRMTSWQNGARKGRTKQ